MLFLFKSTSRNDFDNKRKDAVFVKNYRHVFGLRLPSTEAMDDIFKVLNNDALEILKGHLLAALIDKKVFHRFRFLGTWTVAVDATGVYNWGDSPVDYALHKTSSNGKTTWFSNILEAKLVTTTGLSIPLVSEWIYNGEETKTQFVYITDMNVDRDNMVQFVEHARSRWNIEDSFNTQKNRGYELHHKFNRNNFTAIKNLWEIFRAFS